jgi:hypothetical protein
MALTQEQQIQINDSWKAAFEKFNDLAAEKVVWSDDTRDKCLRYLRGQQIPVEQWVEQVFIVALTETYGDLEKVIVKSREEKEAERTRADQKDSRQRYRKEGDSRPATFDDVKSPFDVINDLLTGKTREAEAPAAEVKAAFPPIDMDMNNVSSENKRLIKALSGDQYRQFLAKRRAWEQAQATTRSMEGNVRLKGESK